MQSNSIIIVQLSAAVHELGEIANEMLFVGGSVIPLFFTSNDNYFRATHDVDCVINVEALVDYYRFIKKLKQCGFRESTEEDSPICRWHKGEVVIDVTPTKNLLGFTNSWYLPAFSKPDLYSVNGVNIKIIPVVYFIAAKLEAFHGRGNNDIISSHDMEDIISIIECRSEIVNEIRVADTDVRAYIVNNFKEFYQNPRFFNDIIGICNPDSLDENNIAKVQERIVQITSLKI